MSAGGEIAIWGFFYLSKRFFTYYYFGAKVAAFDLDGCICWFDMRCKDDQLVMEVGKEPDSSQGMKISFMRLQERKSSVLMCIW
nr:hypothetical protein CFP56_20744 [Quercus suber]